ncbi:Translationally-controlled tumor [Wickerhamiella sorbophila]|uniref:Translationally-controlled tumor protein homolog n=1 Tax=Wickerhamiella sorbophila TaxID=45607 RepID=A0A2T0FHA0_9ASCO|nr:Translationally-controlled tumor [Wickerhamiella sorbophila]PRT54378.1 Translationally-controlled tumor [Wickerhamiella sorbophila]
MLIFTDIVSNDELVSDAFDMKEVDDAVYEVDAEMINVKPGADVDIGANPSAEEAEESLEEGVLQVNNVVYNSRLQETSFDKKSYMVYIKGYMKRVKAYLEEHNPEEVANFEKGATAYVKKVLGSFKDWEFYTGESMDPDGMVVLLNWREDGTTPYLVFWKHGLKSQKI